MGLIFVKKYGIIILEIEIERVRTAHKVKCYYCGAEFDRDTEPTVQVSPRRYAHKKCNEAYGQQKTKAEQEYEELERYIKSLFHEDNLNLSVKRQIKTFKEEYNYTYSGILKSLKYWYEIKKNPTDAACGRIGIVPYIYDEARDYYYHLYLAKLANEGKNIIEFRPKVKEIQINPPCIPRPRVKLFFEEEDEY